MKNCESFASGLPQSLVSMAAHFEQVGGVPCIAVDVNGRQLSSTVDPRSKDAGEEVTPGCKFCRMVRLRDQVMPCEPSAVHRYGVFQAERFGGSFVFFCPANLAYWASPVAVDGKTVGALIAGSVMMIDPDDYLSEEVRVPLALDDGERLILKEQFGKIPYVPPSRVTSLARVLADMAFSLSQKMESHSWWDHTVENQQARIAVLEPRIISFGSPVKLWEVEPYVAKNVVLFGNLPTKKFYSDADVPLAGIESMVAEIEEKLRPTGHPYIISSECDVLSMPGYEKTIMEKVNAMCACGGHG